MGHFAHSGTGRAARHRRCAKESGACRIGDDAHPDRRDGWGTEDRHGSRADGATRNPTNRPR
ncbi:hypothetical protein [Teichococcus wenyumeiae]|uniref:hypothetical protein n=1 Tax=Teichococcus wenyumeiae TaxID=2478470 RepID=UPI0011C3DB73|nr:hypothetical protein [Pseudoroseomonas wenyumeiae]